MDNWDDMDGLDIDDDDNDLDTNCLAPQYSRKGESSSNLSRTSSQLSEGTGLGAWQDDEDIDWSDSEGGSLKSTSTHSKEPGQTSCSVTVSAGKTWRSMVLTHQIPHLHR